MFILTLKVLSILIFEVTLLRFLYQRLRKEEPDRYFSLLELGNTSPISFHVKYIVFRISPILIICFLHYLILPQILGFSDQTILKFNVVLVLTELLVTNIQGYRKYRGLGLAYQHLVFAALIFFTPFIASLLYTKYPGLLPNLEELKNSIWVAIIIYGLFSFFNLFSKNSYDSDNNFNVFTKELLEKRIEKYKDDIKEESLKNNADENLIKAIAIYESIQRPKFFRLIEYVFVFLTRIPVTQSVMQYRSNRFVNDKDSIALAARNYFRDSNLLKLHHYIVFHDAVSKYNFSNSYISDIRSIYEILKKISPTAVAQDSLELIQPEPFQEIGARFVISGWVPKEWLQRENKMDYRISANFLDIQGNTFMGTTINIEESCSRESHVYFHHIAEFKSVNVGFINTSQGCIAIELKAINDKGRAFTPLIVRQYLPATLDQSIVEKHKKIGEMVQKYEHDLQAYYTELQNIRNSFSENYEYEKEDERSHIEDFDLLYGLYEELSEGNHIHEASPYVKQKRLEEQLAEKYKDAIEWQGPLAGASPLRINGFRFQIYSDDHGKHFHVVHEGRGIDARFAFPEMEIIDYKKTGDYLTSKEHKTIREFLLKSENFEKMRKEFERRDGEQKNT